MVFLINELPHETFWLQPGYAKPSLNGNWSHRQCHVAVRGVKRYVHAIATPKDNINIFKTIFIAYDKDKYYYNARHFGEIRNKIESKAKNFLYSNPKLLFRE